jgi:hypothetical protein
MPLPFEARPEPSEILARPRASGVGIASLSLAFQSLVKLQIEVFLLYCINR